MGQALPDRKAVVLVVEDETLVRLSTVEIVEGAGFETIAAANADEAIRILESRSDIRAVFTDVQMPGSIDGLRLARVVRDRWPSVALIVTSGQTNVSESGLPEGGLFEYRRMADDCLRFVNETTNAAEKATLLLIAQTLRQLISGRDSQVHK